MTTFTTTLLIFALLLVLSPVAFGKTRCGLPNRLNGIFNGGQAACVEDRLVAQVCNLLYRRFTIGRLPEATRSSPTVKPRRIQFCDTAECNSALRGYEKCGLEAELQTPGQVVAERHSHAPIEYVVLLHGLGRTSFSMKGLEWYLSRRGYHVINARYPTARRSVKDLAGLVLDPVLKTQMAAGARVNFVTHSQGGILLRQYLSDHEIPNLGRVVMLAPPNHGSELGDILRKNPVTRAMLGPGFLELGTDTNSLPNRLGPLSFDCGVIAGDRSLNPLFSLLLPGPDDGKVTVASAKMDGLADFLVVHNSHTWMMWRANTMNQVLSFLESGRFNHLPGAYRIARRTPTS